MLKATILTALPCQGGVGGGALGGPQQTHSPPFIPPLVKGGSFGSDQA